MAGRPPPYEQNSNQQQQQQHRFRPTLQSGTHAVRLRRQRGVTQQPEVALGAASWFSNQQEATRQQQDSFYEARNKLVLSQFRPPAPPPVSKWLTLTSGVVAAAPIVGAKRPRSLVESEDEQAEQEDGGEEDNDEQQEEEAEPMWLEAHVDDSVCEKQIIARQDEESRERLGLLMASPTAHIIPPHVAAAAAVVASTAPVLKYDADSIQKRLDAFLESKPTIELSGQQYAFIQHAAMGRHALVTGGAGVGKSLAMRLLYEFLCESENKCVFAMAPTATAARQLQKGSTIHSYLGISPAIPSISTWLARMRDPKLRFTTRVQNWMHAQVLLIDEISMVPRALFEFLIGAIRSFYSRKEGTEHVDPSSNTSRACRESDNWFVGGLQIIVCGDFFQLPPVDPPYVFTSLEYHRLFPPSQNTTVLTECFRQRDPVFIEALNQVRLGSPLSDNVHALFESRMLCSMNWTLDEEHRLNGSDSPWTTPPPLLTTHIRTAAIANQAAFDALVVEDEDEDQAVISAIVRRRKPPAVDESRRKKKKKKEVAVDVGDSDDVVDFDLLDDITKQQLFVNQSSVSPVARHFHLKVGARVMLLVNLDFDSGRVNGRMGTVDSFTDEGVMVAFDGGDEPELVEPHTFQQDTCPYTVTQIPLQLAWAITIHKAQSASMERATIDVSDAFEVGQTYTALSRVCSLRGLYLRGWNRESRGLAANAQVSEYYAQLK